MKICLVVLAVLAVCFVTQCEAKPFHFHPFRFNIKREHTSNGVMKTISYHGHHGKVYNFNSNWIFHHDAPVQSDPITTTTTTTTTTTQAPQTPKSHGHHGLKKHFNINWSYNFNHGSSAGHGNANTAVETVTVAATTTEKPFEVDNKTSDFDTKDVDESFVQESEDNTFTGNNANEAINEPDNESIDETVNETETGSISNEYLPPKY
ncbi:unnamed protein product [Diamesa serratosioi]